MSPFDILSGYFLIWLLRGMLGHWRLLWDLHRSDGTIELLAAQHKEDELQAVAAAVDEAYEHGREAGPALESAVCLGEVETTGQMARRLPACLHVFHHECIDPWLRDHTTCPVCRHNRQYPAAA